MSLGTFRVSDLVANRALGSSGARGVSDAVDRLVAAADAALAIGSPRVTDKPSPGPSGDRHDFYSIGKYAWPDPERPGGMPYVRVDCRINPEAFGARYDKARWDRLVDEVKTFALAWFFLRDERYASAASERLSTWFVDKETRMSPHFRYCAALPGVHEGMSSGIIEGAVLLELLDHVALLHDSPSFSNSLRQGLSGWLTDYSAWIRTSDFGREEAAMTNNHGSWWNAQVAGVERVTSSTSQVPLALSTARRHIEQQIASDGSLPAEMRRENSWLYANYGLLGLVSSVLALGEHAAALWRQETVQGLRLHRAFDFLLPFLAGEKSWEHPLLTQEMPDHSGDYALRLAHLAHHLRDPRAAVAIERLRSEPDVDYRLAWLVGPQPAQGA